MARDVGRRGQRRGASEQAAQDRDGIGEIDVEDAVRVDALDETLDEVTVTPHGALVRRRAGQVGVFREIDATRFEAGDSSTSRVAGSTGS